ncbi:hypothetical protein CAPTEDRAFT_185271 [Capitella teleta]|uniref:Uncharacterized protein n=1 Tax=Capitella teleta TaxID=283909 RepID=R7T552_CAPTE|nr:hypothetical protein CAPTEDRAFT_185271 [Capitella teleta]|eukprot:ELT88327.1 hypothetical protein CAPTEDRAFT_185271 [Capitella teleta]
MYEQESRDMIRFIEESRRQLRSIGFDIQSEQEALHRTSMKLYKGAVEASHRAVRLWIPSLSRSKVQPLPQGHEPQAASPSPRPFPVGNLPQDEVYDSDKEYQEEKEKIMRQVTGATQNLERERTRQALITQQKKEQKKAKAVEAVSQMVREASAVEMKKEEDRKRQDELVKQKLEQKKLRQREKTDLFEMSLRSGSATARPSSEIGNIGARGLGSLSARPKTAVSTLADVEAPLNRAAMDAQLKGEDIMISPRRLQEDVPTAWGMDNKGLERSVTEMSYWEEENKGELVIDGDDGHEIKQEKKKKKKKKDKLTRQAASLEPSM